WKGWAILLRQKQKKLIMLPSETMIWQPEFTDKTLSRKPGAVQFVVPDVFVAHGFYGFNVYAQLFHIFIRDRTTAV
ncbi:hypothetical protein, partial [Escherichia coli]|uniref:hypothetical protein n=1 Tax=Escherichia coli TaxID=562 RepID=UPI0019D5813B